MAAYQISRLGVGVFSRMDGGPVRLRRNGRQPKAVGLFFSVKNGRHIPYESKLELHDLWHAETDSAVVRSWAQPFTVSLVSGGELTRYTPDRMDELADGSRRVVEVKDHLTSETEQQRYAPIAELLRQRGMSFELHQRAAIEARPTFSAIQAVVRHRRTFIATADNDRLRRLLADGPAGFGEVARSLGAGVHGHAIFCAAMARRIVRVDLTGGLIPDAKTELVR